MLVDMEEDMVDMEAAMRKSAMEVMEAVMEVDMEVDTEVVMEVVMEEAMVKRDDEVEEKERDEEEKVKEEEREVGVRKEVDMAEDTVVTAAAAVAMVVEKAKEVEDTGKRI
jgi:hypothetical protein